MALNPGIVRTDLSGLIPETVASEIEQGVVSSSAVLQMGRRLANMPSKTHALPVLDMLPQAYWVNGDNGYKQTSKQAWAKKTLYAEELAVIVPIPEAVLDDADYDIWGEVKPRVVEAFGAKIDAAILFGTDKPTNWRAGIVPSATTAGATVTATTDIYTDIMGVGGVIAKVENSGYMPTGIISSIGMRAKLRGIKDADGHPIYKTDMQGATPYALDGSPMIFPTNGAFDASAANLIAGAYNQLVYSIRKDMTYKILTEATIIDPSTKEILYSLAQQDMVALRCVMRLGWEIPNPVNALNQTSSRFPFAVYVPAT